MSFTLLLLSSSQGLEQKEVVTELSMVSKKPLKDCTVGYIPNAGDQKSDKQYMEHSRSILKNIFFDVIEIDLKVLDKDKLIAELNKVDVVFVEGGNTFYLLDIANRSNFTKILPKVLEKGKIYIGVSAGSYIVCPTIEMAYWKNANSVNIRPDGLKNLNALNLVPFLVTAHFDEKQRSIVENAVKHTSYSVVAIYDTEAILVKNSRYKVIGMGAKEFFNGFKESD
ncbi:MAG: Type 1 glutamine amidotransferase-like domain-containing protein [Candidatus Micrarchaeota archaeon]|nr:Type 1 glutamine amidotransferase-like domain-containing protein [Candidatus Micrarchaeota archaeon]